MKEFAELGTTAAMDKNSSGLVDVLDAFTAPPIEEGKGRSETKMFLDGNHTRVSVMSKLVPSPDWFVGLDGLDLCENGKFVDSVTVESDPMDAGTDNGFTFTAPNWATTPPAAIFRITNVYPTHPASSFHYPDLDSLPTIATFSFIKEKEFRLSEVFNIVKDDDGNDVLSVSEVNKYSYSTEDNATMDSTVVAFEPLPFEPLQHQEHPLYNEPERSDHEPDDAGENISSELEAVDDKQDDVEPGAKKADFDDFELTNEIPTTTAKGRDIVKSPRNEHGGGYHASSAPTDFMKKKYTSELLHEASEKLYESKSFYDKIMETYRASKRTGISDSLSKRLRRRKKLRKLRKQMQKHEERQQKEQEKKQEKSKKKHKHNKHRPPRDCKVSEWSPWAPCSKSCGIGEAVRIRAVLKHPKRGGKPCPPELKEVKWCGSARNECRGKYFDW